MVARDNFVYYPSLSAAAGWNCVSLICLGVKMNEREENPALDLLELDKRNARFALAFVLVSSVLTALGAGILAIFALLALGFSSIGVISAGVTVSAVTAAVAAHWGKVSFGAHFLVMSLVVAATAEVLFSSEVTSVVIGAVSAATVIGGLLLRPRWSLIIAALGSLVFVVSRFLPVASPDVPVLHTAGAVIPIIVIGSVIYSFARQARANQETLRRRVEHNARLFQEVPDAAQQLSVAAEEIFSMTEHQTEGTMRQASAVNETRESLRSVKEAAGEIVHSAQDAFKNAQTTLENNERVARDIKILITHTEDIFHLLEVINDVSNKSDLLALNAALEGTKAGEAGRGFSLVATQMQRLAESVGASAKDIKGLTEEIRRATTNTQLSVDGATQLAQATTEAAEKISLITRQQRSSVEQVTAAMDDIGQITTSVTAGTDQTAESAEQLRSLAQHLRDVVEKFRTVVV